MSVQPRTLALIGAALAAALLTAVLHLGLDAEILLWCSPALLLLAPLVAGFFPGERALTACRERRRSQRPRPAGVALPSARAAFARRPRRLLLAMRLAERGPPRALTSC